MAVYKGTNMTLSCEGDIVAYARSVSISLEQETVDTTNADSTLWKSYLGGLKGWSIDMDTLYAYDDIAKKVLMNHYVNGSPTSISVIVTMPDTITYTGEAYLTSLSFTGPYNDVLTATFSLIGTGALAQSSS